MSDARSKLLVIYDSVIVLQATLVPTGGAEKALTYLETAFIEAIMSNRLRSEYEDVLRRPSLIAKYPQLQRDDVIDSQLARIDAMILRVPNAPEQITYSRDPKDVPSLNLAIYYDADFIVTRDKDLLVLDSDPVFRQKSPRTRIVDPVTFIKIVESAE